MSTAPSSVPPSPTPTPSKSRWARAVRRASSVLVPVVRPATPTSDNDAASIHGSTKAGSISGIDTTPSGLAAPKMPQDFTTPSPIAESPAREIAATQEVAAVGPSPLAQQLSAEPSTEPSNEPTQTTPPQEYVPPPLIDSTAVGPGGFTDEPEDLPQTVTIEDPHAPSRPRSLRSVLTTEQPAVQKDPKRDSEPESAPVPAASEVPAPEAITADVVDVKAPSTRPATPSRPSTPPPVVGEAASYFDVQPREESVQGDTHSLVPTDPAESHEPSVIPDNNHSDDSHENLSFPITSKRSQGDLSSTVVAPEPRAAPVPFDLNSGTNVWGSFGQEPVNTRSFPNGDPTSRSSSNYGDPFSDSNVPQVVVSHTDYSSMPNPYVTQQPYDVTQQSSQYSPAPLAAMSIPADTHESRPYDLPQPQVTNERQPLLSGSAASNKPYLFPVGPSSSGAGASPQSPAIHGGVAWANSTLESPHLHTDGWIEYVLPGGTAYYSHPTRCVVTDLNLREYKWLDIAKDHLDHFGDGTRTAAGVELWLQASDITKRGFLPPRFWVDHKAQTVKPDQLLANGHANGKKKDTQDDQLDLHYRYWSFMESHPSHQKLPANSRAEAMDILTWSWTDRLLPSHRTIPAPFNQDECQELMNLLRSFPTEQGETGIQSVIHTRTVSRILLRVVYWRQQYFRPNKPLPKDVGAPAPVKYRRPFLRAVIDTVIGCLCLGIPYLLFDRHRQSRIDEESGYRNATPMAIVGACTCLVAAIVLSATVTFLSLPGLDSFARVAGFVAILFSSFSMASTVVAIFRYKTDMEYPVSHVGVDGLMLLSRRSFVMSLPLVFLAYSIFAIITAIVLYSFRGVAPHPVLSTEPFQEYTKWTVVGVLGGLAGMLTTSVLLVGR